MNGLIFDNLDLILILEILKDPKNNQKIKDIIKNNDYNKYKIYYKSILNNEEINPKIKRNLFKIFYKLDKIDNDNNNNNNNNNILINSY